MRSSRKISLTYLFNFPSLTIYSTQFLFNHLVARRPHVQSNYSRRPGLPASSLPVCPVYRCFFFVPPRHPGLPVVCRYTGVINFFMLAEPLLLLHTPTHAAAHNTTQHAGCCGQQPTLAYTPCHVRQENYANLVTALPPQNSPAAAHAEVACTAFAVILMTTRKSTASAHHALQ